MTTVQFKMGDNSQSMGTSLLVDNGVIQGAPPASRNFSVSYRVVIEEWCNDQSRMEDQATAPSSIPKLLTKLRLNYTKLF